MFVPIVIDFTREKKRKGEKDQSLLHTRKLLFTLKKI